MPARHSASTHVLTESRATSLRSSLLSWYVEHKRDLPWRLPAASFPEVDDTSASGDDAFSRGYDAYIDRVYRCLISETMLQQTQVATVVAYYNKWLTLFPTLGSLAGAGSDSVMSAWAGLGYYSRATRLQKAAAYLDGEFVSGRKQLPEDPAFWAKHVPGVGPYTAGAILSIALDIPVPLVDGNVSRVASRILAIHGDVTTPKSPGASAVWAFAKEVVTAGGGRSAGDVNQSLMELGATVCTPVGPACERCPVSGDCSAYRGRVRHTKSGGKSADKAQAFFSKRRAPSKVAEPITQDTDLSDIEDLCTICPTHIDPDVLPPGKSSTDYIALYYPFKVERKKAREEVADVLVCVREGDGKVLLEKKGGGVGGGLLAGLWDFPTVLRTTETPAIPTDLHAHTAGQTVHLFTHIRRTSIVHVTTSADADGDRVVWGCGGGEREWADLRVDKSEIGVAVSELCLRNWRCAAAFIDGDMKLSQTSGKKRAPTATPAARAHKKQKPSGQSTLKF
ncbi:hypothetical protein PYCC9005_004914 [Savitreella phatthalungensis]